MAGVEDCNLASTVWQLTWQEKTPTQPVPMVALLLSDVN
jgi:hypothetical protein